MPAKAVTAVILALLCLGAGEAWAGRQAVLVVSTGWEETAGTLYRFEREDDSRPWRRVGEGVPVMLGRGGLGWGRGINDVWGPGPVKREGDGRAPAGVFRLRRGFAYGPEAARFSGRLPVVPIRASLVCVDDPDSPRYNTLVDRAGLAVQDWSSHEEMLRADGQYRHGVFVEHNTAPARPGGGSCIMIHIWRGPGQPTAGCTAMDQRDVLALMEWLDPAQEPVLIQLPRAEVENWRLIWDLPGEERP